MNTQPRAGTGWHTGPGVLLGVVALAGLLLRLRGVTWGLPYLYDPDEHFLVDPAVGFVTSGGNLNPHSFFYPGTTIMYLLGLAYFGYWVVGHFAGWFPDLQVFAGTFASTPSSFYLIARILAATLSTVSIPLVYGLGRTMAGTGAALAAATFVALSPLHVDYARVVRTDPLMTVFLLAAMLSAVKAMDSPSAGGFFLTGIFIGLATATKLPGVSGALIPVLAIVLAQAPPAAPWALRTRWLGAAFLGGMAGFFGAAPFIVTGIREVYWVLMMEGSRAHLSATGTRGVPNYLWYLKWPLRHALGLPLELMALLGFLVSCRVRSRPRLLLLSFSLLFLLGIGMSLKRWDRWIVPLVPFVAILAALGVERIVQALRWLRTRPLAQDGAVVALGLALVIPSVSEGLYQGGLTLDTRDIAKAWIERHVPSGARLAVEQYTPPVSRAEYQVFVEERGSLKRDTTTTGYKGVLADLRALDPLRANEIEYVVVSNYLDRYRAERASYPDEVRFYEQLFRVGELLYELKPRQDTKGPVIRVLKVRPFSASGSAGRIAEHKPFEDH